MTEGNAVPLVLPLAAREATLTVVGGKGESLARLARAGLPVPPGFHITTAAYRRFVEANGLQDEILTAVAQAHAGDPVTLEAAAARIRERFEAAPIPDDVADAVRDAYAQLSASGATESQAEPDGEERVGDIAVAVRSSATAEDLPGMSFAGQQESFLNVRGAVAVLEHVRRCWGSLWTARAIGYRTTRGVEHSSVSLAVVVQRLVVADAAGVLFTANPVTGARDEVLVNASWGLGEAIVGGEVTPDSLTIDKATGRVREQLVAEKTVMTVRTPAGTQLVPVPAAQRHAAVLSPDAIHQLARLGRDVEALYGQPMDVEWAIEGGRVYLLQARPITALPEPAPSPVTEGDEAWRVEGKGYARSSVIELLPDPLSPLFATLALPEWNAAMRHLMAQMGVPGPMPEEMLTTVNGYAYYHYGDIPPRAMIRFLGVLPRLVPLLRRAAARWQHEAHPVYAAVAQRWEARDLAKAKATDLLAGMQEIARAAAEHYLAIQSGILPAAYMSEALFTAAYDRLLKGRGDPPALTFVLGFESAPLRAEQSLYNLASWAKGHGGLASWLARTPGATIAQAVKGAAGISGASESNEALPPSGVDAGAWREFQEQWQRHVRTYGHAVYDLDFAKPLPADEPGPLLDTLRFFLEGQAPDPHARQADAAAAREAATRRLLARLDPVRRRVFRTLLRIAQRFAPLREDALMDVGLGWPVLRRMAAELGRRLVAGGALAGVDDVFWLTAAELQAAAGALDAGNPVTDYQEQVRERRATWQARRRLTPPPSLPPKARATFAGFDFTRFLPARADDGEGAIIRGVGASPGRMAGTACVLHGPEDFGQMRPGGVLVAKITTPAWTPLFALASAVVTDVGGPLSHSSIVAREYHIPAVLGTGVATARIQMGQRIEVDGDAGTVRLLDTPGGER